MSKQTSTNNVLLMKVNIVFKVNTNSPSADRRESTNLDTLSDFTKKIIFDFGNSYLASYLTIQVIKKQKRCNLKKLYALFLWMGFNYLKDIEPLRGDNLLLTTNSFGVTDTSLIYR